MYSLARAHAQREGARLASKWLYRAIGPDTDLWDMARDDGDTDGMQEEECFRAPVAGGESPGA